ncbi:MAG: VOC family protein [Dehalococcoidia bacterium]
MDLGAFSISLAVKDLAASRTFYESLGFEVTGGDAAENWLILKNGESIIGLFHGMFEKNILTFNPGLTIRMEVLSEFQDVRDIQAALKQAGLALGEETDPAADGPAHITLTDPDGNPILIDQFYPSAWRRVR